MDRVVWDCRVEGRWFARYEASPCKTVACVMERFDHAGCHAWLYRLPPERRCIDFMSVALAKKMLTRWLEHRAA